MKNKALIQASLSVFFLIGILISISPSLSLYKEKEDEKVINIGSTPVVTYKLVASQDIYLNATYVTGAGDDSGNLTCDTSGSTTFDLALDDGVYKTNWDSNTQSFYATSATTFSWNKYVDNVFSETIGTATVDYEGVYSITPTLQGNAVNLGLNKAERAIYLKISTNWSGDWNSGNNWTSGGAWFACYAWPGDVWIRADNMGDNYYRVFIDTDTYTGFKFSRLCPSSNGNYKDTNYGYNWDNQWNGTADIKVSTLTSKDSYIVKGWGSSDFEWGNK